MIQMLPIVLRVARDHIDFLNLRNDQFHRMDNVISTLDKLGELYSLCYNCEIHTNVSAYLDLLRQCVDDTVIALDNLDRTVLPSNRRTRGEPATARTTASVPGQTTFEEIYGLSGEQYQQTKPSRHLALMNGREVMLRSIAMGLVWDNGMKTCGSLVKALFDRYSEDMYYSANREFGSTEYIARKKIALNMTAILDVDLDSLGARRLLGKVVKRRGDQAIVELYELVPRPAFGIHDDSSLISVYQADLGGNLVTKKTEEILDLLKYKLTMVELLDMSQETEIDTVKYSLINKCKFGTFWWLHNTNRYFKILENERK
ncbi:uncharacterized protein EV154DRAFT_533081 [Mucor mucedo]|uniref:uncharacterized protein n=1 Tax=Mucor mucedo TaxID=29922 RepID=UPI002220F388|nr:uncharacterized protein EV154DRAFT_533081 [Mucor mucedo]KAI7865547.1 hypothetical protein EV154DRAFT_533081 [Mucor mucedo]